MGVEKERTAHHRIRGRVDSVQDHKPYNITISPIAITPLSPPHPHPHICIFRCSIREMDAMRTGNEEWSHWLSCGNLPVSLLCFAVGSASGAIELTHWGGELLSEERHVAIVCMEMEMGSCKVGGGVFSGLVQKL